MLVYRRVDVLFPRVGQWSAYGQVIYPVQEVIINGFKPKLAHL